MSLKDKDLFIHIGLHKTGSTSIQKALAEDKSGALKRHSIYYPVTGRPKTDFTNRFGQHELAWALDDNFPAFQVDIWEEFYEEVAQVQERKILISAERFSRLPLERKTQLSNLVGEFGRIKLVVYFRNPKSLLISAYKQHVKGRASCSQALLKFCAENKNLVKYAEITEQWARVFGAENLIVKVFEYELKQLGLIRGFFEAIGCEENQNEIKDEHSNRSPTDSNVRLIRALNQLGDSLPPHARSSRFYSRLKSKAARAKWNPYVFAPAFGEMQDEKIFFIDLMKNLNKELRLPRYSRFFSDAALNRLLEWNV